MLIIVFVLSFLVITTAMSASEEVKLSLKVVLNKEKNKVLFAEVDSTFADVLLSFLTLPLGTIVRLLGKYYGDQAPTIGSFNTLYQGLSDLESSHFWTETGKKILLNVRNPLAFLCQKLKLNLDDSSPTRYFRCSDRCSNTIAMNRHDLKCRCGHLLSAEIVLPSSSIQTGSGHGGVFTQETASFLITDALQVLPNSAVFSMQILNSLGIRDAAGLEQRTVAAGFKEIMDLLKCALFSTTPLSDFILKKRQTVSSNMTSQLPHTQDSATPKKVAVNAFIRKSTSKILMVQADEYFVNFLFSLLVIPLGRVVCLLGSDIPLGGVYSLYSSITNLECGKYLKTESVKSVLLKPLVPPEYFCVNQILPLTEDIAPVLYYRSTPAHFADLNGIFSFIKGPKLFMVTDDLVVTPSPAFSSLSILNSHKIPLSDVEELELEIGMEEALNILKASLTSTSALTDGLKPFLKKQVKQEK